MNPGCNLFMSSVLIHVGLANYNSVHADGTVENEPTTSHNTFGFSSLKVKFF